MENKTEVFKYDSQTIYTIFSILDNQFTGISNNKVADAIKSILINNAIKDEEEKEVG